MNTDTTIAVTPELYFSTMFSYQRTAALKAAIELDVFTAIDEGARAVPEIATRCRASERGIAVLCDYLTVIGFLRKEQGSYSLTPDTAAFLSKRSPAYLGATAEFLANPESIRSFEHLTEIVRRGTIPPSANMVSDDNPVWVQFARAMMPMMAPAAQAIGDVLDVAGKGPLRVLDIAASHGLFGIELARRNPHVKVVAVDWAAVLDVATDNASRVGVRNQLELVPGDAFKVEFDGPFDIALITNFLHHFDRATNTAFMRKVATALKPGGRAVVLEFVPNDDRVSPPIAAAFAMTMLGGTPNGTTYTLRDLENIARDAGFTSVAAHAAPPQTIVVAVK